MPRPCGKQLSNPFSRKKTGKERNVSRLRGRLNEVRPSCGLKMDYRALGLMVGLEIHQQLATHKLFCEDTSGLVDVCGGQRVRRRLRARPSEPCEVGAAAIDGAIGGVTLVYDPTH